MSYYIYISMYELLDMHAYTSKDGIDTFLLLWSTYTMFIYSTDIYWDLMTNMLGIQRWEKGRRK